MLVLVLRTKGKSEAIRWSNLVAVVVTNQMPYMTRKSKPLLYFKFLFYSG